MNASDRRALKLITQSKGDVRASLKAFLKKPKHYRKAAQIKREADEKEERLSKKGATAAIREACVARADGLCEECRTPFLPYDPAEMDHFFGRGRVQQSEENCWMLHRSCHRQKTENTPSRSYWASAWATHCERNGITPHAPVARKLSRALGAGAGSPLPSSSVPDARDLHKVNQ